MTPMQSAKRPPRCPVGYAVLVAALIATGGCAVAPPRSASPTARIGYEQRVDELASVDASALAGKRIALDPGHGGFFAGALGVKGLTEAEVNLGVSLHLRGLLEARGASVLMTRTDNRDFLVPTDSTLRSDLAERVRIANAWGPDLFISVHHNADARGAHDVNETQTYYKLGDDGPSLDAAQSVHRYLVRNLGIGKNRVLPGNYYVLRNSDAPALLTESSYITHPDVEAKLVLASKQRLEAEALLLGIAHYFARRAPVIEELTVLADPGVGSSTRAPAPRDSVFGTAGEPRLRARIGGGFDHAELRLDGAPLPIVRQGEWIEATPPPLAPGEHVATLSAGLAGRGAARARTVRFRVHRPLDATSRVTAAAWPAEYSDRDAAIGVGVRIEDRYGFPIPDSLPVRYRAPRGRLAPEETTAVARDGVAWAYFRPLGTETATPGASTRASARAAAPLTVTAEVGAGPAPLPARATIARASGTAPARAVFLRRAPSDSALAGAPGTREPRSGDAWINRDGFAVLPLDDAGAPIVPPLPGYRPWAVEGEGDASPSRRSDPPLRWTAIAGGALHDRRIVIDPDGGGENPAGVGRDGTRGAHLNLEVARALEGLLTAAGAQVLLTRRGDLALSEVERVQMSEAFRADRFIRIGHAAEKPRIGFYYSSAAGKRWGQATAAELERFGFAAVTPGEDAQYPLQQTSCPALYVSAARVDQPASEDRLLAPGTLRTEAYALFVALAREWASPAAEWPMDSIELRDADDRPVGGASVILGGALVLETDAAGRARFARTEPGPIDVRVRDPRVSASRRLLESQRSTVMTGSRGP